MEASVAVNRMRTEEGEGVGVASGKDGVNLRDEARIAEDNRCGVLHGWALLRQVGDLRKVANEGLADKLSPNADSRPLNSRALAGKCQTETGMVEVYREKDSLLGWPFCIYYRSQHWRVFEWRL